LNRLPGRRKTALDRKGAAMPLGIFRYVRLAALSAALMPAAALALAATAARAQPLDYPTQRITLVVGFAAGGPVDIIARIVAEALQRRWNQTVVVENRGGAGGNIAAALVARAAPDGATLLFSATGVAINQSLYESPGYSIKALIPISIAATNNLVFAINPVNPARTLEEFVAAHRAASFTFGTAGVGSGAHITAEYFFKVLAKVEAIHTPFQGSVPAVTALLGNHIDLVSVPLPDTVSYVQQGTLRALAVAGATRSAALPDVPTFGEAGYPGFVSSGWIALFAPAQTPPAIAAALNQAVNDILQSDDAGQRLAALGFIPNRQSLPDTARHLDQELASWSRMVDAIGLKIR
jgi:tripartite-type tricarboxylate transporter receptor subunit TctC